MTRNADKWRRFREKIEFDEIFLAEDRRRLCALNESATVEFIPIWLPHDRRPRLLVPQAENRQKTSRRAVIK
jgi:hypothetical protein